MTTVIEAYNYKIGLDVSSLQSGGIITKRELGQLKRDFYSLQDPVERSAGKLDRLANALNKGAVDYDRYAEAVSRVKASFPETIAAQQRQNELEKQSASIKRSLMTETQLVSAESKRLGEMVRAGKLSFDEAKQAMTSYKSGLPSAAAAARELARAEKERAELQRFANSITQAGMTAGQRYAAEMTRVNAAVREAGLSQADATRHLQEYAAAMPKAIAERQRLSDLEQKAGAIRRKQLTEDQQIAAKSKELSSMVTAGKLSRPEGAQELRAFKAELPSAIAAERQLADARREVLRITQAGMSDQKRYAAEQARVAALVKNNGLSQADANNHLKAYRATLPSVIATEQQRTAATQRADAMTEKYMRSTDRLGRELREINALEKAGSIDARTAAMGRRDARRTATAGRLTELAGVPGLGGLAGRAGQLMALSGPLAVVAGGAIAVTAAFRAGHAAAAAFVDAMRRDADAMSAAYHSANLLQTSVESLIGFQYAVAQTNGMTGDEAIGLIEKLSTNIADAAAGTGKAKAVIEQLGLDAKSLSMQDPADAMKVLFDSVSKLENPVEQARIAVKLFGREGIAMAENMRQGSAGIKAAEDRARELGLIISGMDSAGINAALDSMMDVDMVMSGIVRQFNTGFYPAVTAISGELTAWLTPLTDSRDVGELIAIALTVVAGATADAVGSAVALSRVLYNIQTLDFSEAVQQFNELQDHASGGTSKRLGERFMQAKIDAAKAAEEMKRNKSIERAALGSENLETKETPKDLAEKEVKKEIESLKERNLELQMGKDWVTEYKRLNSGAADSVKQEHAELLARNKELERAAKIKEQSDGLEKQLNLARESNYIATRMPGIDEETAGQLAELRLLGATGTELNRHLQLRREIVAIDGRKQADKDAADRYKQLAEDAKQIKDSLRSPMEGLAEDFTKLTDMYTAGMLSAEQYAEAKNRAARELVKLPSDVGTKAVSRGDGSEIYAGLVESQNARDKRSLENMAADQLQRQAELLAQREAARFEATKLVTDQMREQARLAGVINQLNPQPGGAPQNPGGTTGVEDTEMLDRIASACERAADRLSDWKIVGV